MSLCLARNKSAFEMNDIQREDVPGRLQFARHRGNFGRPLCHTFEPLLQRALKLRQILSQ